MLLYRKSPVLISKAFPGGNLDVQLLCCLEMHLSFFSCENDHTALKYLWNLLLSIFNLCQVHRYGMYEFVFPHSSGLVRAFTYVLAYYKGGFFSELSFPRPSPMRLTGCWSSCFKVVMSPLCYSHCNSFPSSSLAKGLACGIFSPMLNTLHWAAVPA